MPNSEKENDVDDLDKEIEQIVKESGLAKQPRRGDVTHPCDDFMTGMDYEKFLVTSDHGASQWKVFVRGANGTEVAAQVVPVGTWLNAWNVVAEGESAWIVDRYLLPSGEAAQEVRIVIPGRDEAFILPHPNRH